MAFPELDGRRVLVTGAMGFLGRHLVRTLAEGSEVRLRLLTRAATPDAPPAAARARSQLVSGDLTDAPGVARLCDGVDVVIHAAAAMPGQPGAALTPDGYRRGNVDATLRLAIQAAAAGVRRFVLVSSTAAMGTPAAPVVDEATPCQPASPYDVTKRLAEEGLLALGPRAGLFLADRGIDIGKARRELGYAQQYRDLKGMLGRTYAWYGLSGQL